MMVPSWIILLLAVSTFQGHLGYVFGPIASLDTSTPDVSTADQTNVPDSALVAVFGTPSTPLGVAETSATPLAAVTTPPSTPPSTPVRVNNKPATRNSVNMAKPFRNTLASTSSNNGGLPPVKPVQSSGPAQQYLPPPRVAAPTKKPAQSPKKPATTKSPHYYPDPAAYTVAKPPTAHQHQLPAFNNHYDSYEAPYQPQHYYQHYQHGQQYPAEFYYHTDHGRFKRQLGPHFPGFHRPQRQSGVRNGFNSGFGNGLGSSRPNFAKQQSPWGNPNVNNPWGTPRQHGPQNNFNNGFNNGFDNGFGQQNFGQQQGPWGNQPDVNNPGPTAIPPWLGSTESPDPNAAPTAGTTIAGCNCPTTPEFNPVCGADRVTYFNPSRLRCSNRCGNRVAQLHGGACVTTTTSTQRTPSLNQRSRQG